MLYLGADAPDSAVAQLAKHRYDTGDIKALDHHGPPALLLENRNQACWSAAMKLGDT